MTVTEFNPFDDEKERREDTRGSGGMQRMRTAAGALKIIREQDPETAVTLRYIRQLITTGAVASSRVGRKRLINVDRLIEYLTEGEKG